MFDSPIPAGLFPPFFARRKARLLSLPGRESMCPPRSFVFIIPHTSRPCNKLSVKQIARKFGLFEVF
ncbi:MAG TPA: hypothetical protein DEP43_03420 [Ruminococcaceae bacterium]|nr:hypothetical protein [Oscillospiraceae bacterium]HCB64999.1 hypothetical protein [Oscillospiraceae bacterium]